VWCSDIYLHCRKDLKVYINQESWCIGYFKEVKKDREKQRAKFKS
jgi:hypothetical protein